MKVKGVVLVMRGNQFGVFRLVFHCTTPVNPVTPPTSKRKVPLVRYPAPVTVAVVKFAIMLLFAFIVIVAGLVAPVMSPLHPVNR